MCIYSISTGSRHSVAVLLFHWSLSPPFHTKPHHTTPSHRSSTDKLNGIRSYLLALQIASKTIKISVNNFFHSSCISRTCTRPTDSVLCHKIDLFFFFFNSIWSVVDTHCATLLTYTKIKNEKKNTQSKCYFIDHWLMANESERKKKQTNEKWKWNLINIECWWWSDLMMIRFESDVRAI